VAKRYILQQVSEGTNRNMPARNTLVQLLALYTNSERHMSSVTDRQMDKGETWWCQQSIILCSSTIG